MAPGVVAIREVRWSRSARCVPGQAFLLASSTRVGRANRNVYATAATRNHKLRLVGRARRQPLPIRIVSESPMKTSLVKLLLVTVAFGVALPCLGQEFLGKSADAWERDLNSTIPKTRRHAAFALGKLGKHAASAVPTLKKIMREDHDARVREAAAYALGEIATHSLAAAQDEDLVVVLGEALTKDA